MLYIRKIVAKMKKVINAEWRILKSAGVKVIKEKLYLVHTIVRAGCLYEEKR